MSYVHCLYLWLEIKLYEARGIIYFVHGFALSAQNSDWPTVVSDMIQKKTQGIYCSIILLVECMKEWRNEWMFWPSFLSPFFILLIPTLAILNIVYILFA